MHTMSSGYQVLCSPSRFGKIGTRLNAFRTITGKNNVLMMCISRFITRLSNIKVKVIVFRIWLFGGRGVSLVDETRSMERNKRKAYLKRPLLGPIIEIVVKSYCKSIAHTNTLVKSTMEIL